MYRIVLSAALVISAAAPALSQDGGLPLPNRPSVVETGEQVLSGRKTWAQGKSWLVTDDGRRYHLPSARRNAERMKMAHGWLDDQRVEVRAQVTQKRGVPTIDVKELLDPRVRELRATVEEEAGTLYLSTGDERLRVRDQFSGPRLVRPLVGSQIDVRAFVFKDGTAWVKTVKARALHWHFQPIVVMSPLLIPRWKGPGTEYWVHYRATDGEVAVGIRHIDASKFDFNAPGSQATETPNTDAKVGLKDLVE